MAFPLKVIEGIPNLTFTIENAQTVLGNMRNEYGTAEENAIRDLGEELANASDVFAAATNPATAKKIYKLALVVSGLYDPQDFLMQ